MASRRLVHCLYNSLRLSSSITSTSSQLLPSALLATRPAAACAAAGTSTSNPPLHRGFSSSGRACDLREFIDWSHERGEEPETHGRAWRDDELRLKGWEDLHKLWYLCIKERNMLLTAMAWREIPKDLDEQKMWGLPRGSSKEEDVHRLRYGEVQKSLKRIKKVMRERAKRELNPAKRWQIFSVLLAK